MWLAIPIVLCVFAVMFAFLPAERLDEDVIEEPKPWVRVVVVAALVAACGVLVVAL